MRNWLLILCTSGLILSVGISRPADLPATTELAYQGKPLTYWLTALEPSRSASSTPKQAEAEAAIHAIGPEAVPLILQYSRGSRDERLDVIRHACSVLEPEGDAKIVEALHDPVAKIRETALEVISKTAATAAMGDLIQALADPVKSVHNAAIQALVRNAPDKEETVTALIDSLQPENQVSDKMENPFSREDAALTLAGLGSKAKAAVPELMKLLDDPSDDVREAGATALWRIEHNTNGVSILVERLENAQNYQTYIKMSRLLAEMGAAAKLAVPVIQQKIEDPGIDFVPPTVDLRQIALSALSKIDPKAAAATRKKIGEDAGSK